MSVLAIGVDPGVSESKNGGIAWIYKTGRKTSYGAVRCITNEPAQVITTFNEISVRCPRPDNVVVAVEFVTTFAPGGRTMGTGSAARVGEMTMCPKTVAACFGIPCITIRPQDWHKFAFEGKKKPKAKETQKKRIFHYAQQRWPRASLKFPGADSGPAEALWIAYAAMQREF